MPVCHYCLSDCFCLPTVSTAVFMLSIHTQLDAKLVHCLLFCCVCSMRICPECTSGVSDRCAEFTGKAEGVFRRSFFSIIVCWVSSGLPSQATVSTGVPLLITSPAGAVAKYCNEHARARVCLSVSRLAYFPNRKRDLYLIFCSCCQWPWLGPPLAG